MARLAALTTILAAAGVMAQQPSALPQFSGYNYSGSGCPVNSGAVTHSGGDYTAERWGITGFTSTSTSNCEIHLSAGGATPGWQVALAYVKIDGTVTLSSGATLDLFADYFWSNAASTTVEAQGSISGAYDNSHFSVSVAIPQSDLLWSQCIGSDGNPGILDVDVRGAIDGSGSGSFTITSEEWDFQWRQC